MSKLITGTKIHQFRYICEDCSLDKVALMKFPLTFSREQRAAGIQDTVQKMYQQLRGPKVGCRHPNEITYRTFDESLLESK